MTAETLILAWGNPGRRDDGLGPAFAQAFAQLELPGVEVNSGYQLQVEDAADVARFRRVVFVDADRGGPAPFRLRRLRPAGAAASFSTHSVSPDTVLALTRDLFQAEPEGWLLGVRGYEFDKFGEGLSDAARANLSQAVDFLRSAVQAAAFPIASDYEGEPCQTKSP